MRNQIKNVYLTIIAASIIAAIYFSYITIKHQFIGVDAVYNKQGYLVVIEVEKDAYGEKIGLEVGDIIIEIDYDDPAKHHTIKYSRLEQVKQFRVLKKDGTIVSHTVEKEFDIQFVYQFIVPMALFSLSLYCSYFIYRSNAYNTHKSPLLLIIFLLTISLAYLSASASTRGDVSSRYINLLLFISTPAVYLHYIYTYFKEIGQVWFSKKNIIFLYSLSIINIIIETTDVYSTKQLIYITLIINLSSFLLSFIITYILIGLGLKRVSYKAQKYMIRVILISSILAFFPFVFLYIIPLVFFGVLIFSPGFLASFLLIIPFSLVYQFLATKVYDIEFLLGRFRYYILLSITPAIIAVLIAINNNDIDPTAYAIRTFISLLVLLFLTFIVKEILDHKFKLQRFSEKYNYKDSILKFTKQIRGANTLSEVIDELRKIILEVLIVSDVHFVHVDYNGNVVKIDTNNKFEKEYKEEIKKAASGETGTVVELKKGFIINVGESNEGYYLLICLSKINTPKLTIDEKSWLNALSYYTNVTISNFLKIESLMDHLNNLKNDGKSPVWYNRVLYQLEEKQRSTLAKDLHDSVLQDLISIKRKCEVALEDYRKNPSQAEHHLRDIYDKLNNAILMTRETCNELRPQILYDLGLKKALEKLISQYKDSVKFNITLNISRLHVPEQIDLQLSIYRIVQELLANSRKHSHAKKVLLMLISIKDKIVLHYEDDGVGANHETLFEKEKSMGLSGIKERVNALNGTMEIQTDIGEGFKVIIEI